MKAIDVLMVEDNPGDVLLVREAMEEAGLRHVINVVTDGVDALDYLFQRGSRAGSVRPDLIVLDLKLPRRSGREILEELRPIPELNAIPIVILSSSRSELETAKATGRTEELCIPKPTTFAGYVDLVWLIEKFRLAAQQDGSGVYHGRESDESSAG